MKQALMMIVFLVGCGSGEGGPDVEVDAPTNLPACTMATYDPCTSNTQCTSGNCHLFSMEGIQICTTACTPNDDSTCPTDSAGAASKCNNRGICRPTVENACAP